MLSVQCISYSSVLKTQLEMFCKYASSENTQTQNIFKILVLVLKMALNFLCLIFTQYLLYVRIKFCEFFKIAKIAKT